MKSLMQIITFALLSIGSLEAKSYGSSSSSRSSSSSSSSRSSSSSSPSRSYNSSSSSSSSKATVPSSSSASKPNTSKPQTSTRPASKVETARYKEAVKSGKVFKTREDAVADFKATKASSYTSRYASEPTSRPEHIPSTYRGSNGQTYNVTYNQQGGGYGYWGGGGPGLGTFILYDMASDAIMMNAMMSRNNYHVGPPPVAHTTHVHHTSNGWGWFWFTILFGTLAVIAVIFFINRSI